MVQFCDNEFSINIDLDLIITVLAFKNNPFSIGYVDALRYWDGTVLLQSNVHESCKLCTFNAIHY